MSVADWKLRAGQGQGVLIAVAVFLAMFTLYIANHPAGLTVPVATTAANKAVLLALVAMAQTLPVLTGGLDLSVGTVSVMTNSLPSSTGTGQPWPVALGILAVLLAGPWPALVHGAPLLQRSLQPNPTPP